MIISLAHPMPNLVTVPHFVIRFSMIGMYLPK